MNNQLIINGQLVSYVSSGKSGGGYALIFLHGWRSQKEIWQPITSYSPLATSHLFFIDLPGFGGSPAPKQPWSVGDYANLVAEFIKKLDLKNVIIIGHSFGGRVGIKLASTRADLVKKLVLVDAAGFAMNQGKKSTINLAAKIVKPIFKPKFMQGLRKKIYKKIGAEDYVAKPEMQETFVTTIGEDLTENMKRILQPTLLVWGENDKDTPPGFGEKMHSLIPNSKLQILPNAGHFSFLDQPDEFVKILNEFLNV